MLLVARNTASMNRRLAWFWSMARM
jgi:hypothetical protein